MRMAQPRLFLLPILRFLKTNEHAAQLGIEAAKPPQRMDLDARAWMPCKEHILELRCRLRVLAMPNAYTSALPSLSLQHLRHCGKGTMLATAFMQRLQCTLIACLAYDADTQKTDESIDFSENYY